MSGFTYNGIHCSEFNVEYIPNAEGRWFAGPEYRIYEKDAEWHHGGYYFGNKVNIRKFELPCYFEEITIAQREKIRRWLGRNTYGQLIFDDMPFMYYMVRPENIVVGEIYNDYGKYSGTFTIPFTAHKPFGYLMRKSNNGTEDDDAEDYCGLIPASMMPAAPTTSSRSFMVYNPGTERCGMTIRLSGTANNPIMFLNNTNGTSCIFESLPTNNLVLDIDGEIGIVKTYAASNPDNFELGYMYHDRGVVRLEPNETTTGITYEYIGSNGTMKIIELSGIDISSEMIGDRILFNNASSLVASVQAVSTANNTVTCTISGSGTLPESGTCSVSSINNIQILEKNSSGSWVAPTGLTLNSISIDYQPRLL